MNMVGLRPSIDVTECNLLYRWVRHDQVGRKAKEMQGV